MAIYTPENQQLANAEADVIRVLLVDDSRSTQHFLRALLQRVQGLRVVGVADTGQKAVEYEFQLQPELILLDVMLPDFNGEAVLPVLLQVAPNAKVVYLSNRSKAIELRSAASGAAGYIEKGLEPRQLLERLGAIVGRPLVSSALLPDPGTYIV